MQKSDQIIITGADGFLGSHLTDLCYKKNATVSALIKPQVEITNLKQYTNGKIKFYQEEKVLYFEEKIEIPTSDPKLTIVECDIRNNKLLDSIIERVKPDYLFHFAAQPHVLPSWEDPVKTIETNIIGTINIFESIKNHELKTRVINACSSAEYGTTTKLKRPLREDDSLLAIHPYGISKIAAELLARQYFINFNIEIINLRFFNQTGTRKENDACSDFVKKVAQIELGLIDPTIEVGNLDTIRDITGIRDTLNAIWVSAIKGTPGETYNVCSSKKTKIRDVLNTVLSFSKKKIKIIEKIPTKLRVTDEEIILGDNTKIRNELGFEITQTIEQTLKEMYDYWIEYYKNNGL